MMITRGWGRKTGEMGNEVLHMLFMSINLQQVDK